MSILLDFVGGIREIFITLDGVAYSLLDNAYNIVIELASARILEHDQIKNIVQSLYIIFSVVAFFRLAMVLVNSIIDPEKLTEKGKGLSNIFFRVVGMIGILAVTPFIFEKAYELQGKIIGENNNGKNVIFSLILGDKANIGGYKDGEYNAGKALQNIVLSSLITIDNEYLVNNGAVCKMDELGNVTDKNGNAVSDVEGNCGFIPLTCVKDSSDSKTCTMQGGYIYADDKDGKEGECDWPNCHKAVDNYNDMYVNEKMSPNGLHGLIGTSKKIDGVEVHVYNYMLIVTTVAGVAITWIILSFAIDFAVRMFELVVLEILSPLFIATFVDPKSTQSGPFKNWLTAVGKSYASLFIKIAVLALMIMLIMVINQSNIFSNMNGQIGGFAKVIAIFGLLIFAKKAPKWIMDIIGIKGDEGLGGLSIGKKLASAALVGGLATKAGEGLKKQRDKLVDHGKKRLGNAANKAYASYATRREANKAARNEWRNNHPNAGKVLHLSDRKKARADYEAKNGAIKDKTKAARAQVQADFVANNDLRAFANLKDKYAENAQRINPSYKTGREQKLNALNQKVSDLNEAAKIDSSSLGRARKNASDIQKAITIYGEDYVRQHIKSDGSLDKVACPLNEQQINNAYSGVLNHAPNDVREIAIAQLKLKNAEITEKSIKSQMDGWNSYEKALYNSAAFENNVLNQSNYISAEQGKTKADQELAELYSQLQAYKNNYVAEIDEETHEVIPKERDPKYTAAIQNFEDLIKSKKETSGYYEGRIKVAKENFVNAFLNEHGKPILEIGTDGKFYSKDPIPEDVIKNNDSVVEINGEYMTKFGKFEKKDDGFHFKEQDMSQEMELINTEQEGKRNGKIKNSLEAAKPAELKQAEKED